MKSQFTARVVACREAAPDHFELIFAGAEPLRGWEPGHFVMVRGWPGQDPLLGRAFSLYGVEDGKGEAAILFRVAGRGTALLSRLKPGDPLEVRGPLGRPFAPVRVANHHILLGGGIGVAPLVPLAVALKGLSLNFTFIIGARKRAELLGTNTLKQLGIIPMLTTDDGSAGIKGVTTALLPELLATTARPALYACGPEPMLRAVAASALPRGVPCQVSLESHMACGYGACLGCAVSTNKGYRRVCTEGPVFEARDVFS